MMAWRDHRFLQERMTQTYFMNLRRETKSFLLQFGEIIKIWAHQIRALTLTYRLTLTLDKPATANLTKAKRKMWNDHFMSLPKEWKKWRILKKIDRRYLKILNKDTSLSKTTKKESKLKCKQNITILHRLFNMSILWKEKQWTRASASKVAIKGLHQTLSTKSQPELKWTTISETILR